MALGEHLFMIMIIDQVARMINGYIKSIGGVNEPGILWQEFKA